MAELKERDVESANSYSGEVTDLVDHWVQAIDDWIERLDQGMGGSRKGADPAEAGQPPDPLPGAAVATG